MTMTVRWSKRAMIPISIVGVFIIVCILIIHQVNKPVTARIITAIGNASAPATSVTPQAITVKDDYISFLYPSSMKPLQQLDALSGSELSVYNYEISDIVPWHLAITVTQLHGPSLLNDSGYLLRKNDPTRYTASSTTYGANTFSMMTDTQAQGFGEVAFSLHGSESADISLTGDDPAGDANLANTLQQVLQSWQWQ
jgi:hypothetical protein